MVKNRVKLISILHKDDYAKETTLNMIFKVISVLLGYLMVRISLDSIGEEQYSIWVTISSIVAWAYLTDLGITNGLRNRLASNYMKDFSVVQKDVSVAIKIFMLISAIVFILGSIFIICFPINRLFRGVNIDIFKIRLTFLILLLGFCFNFILNIGNAISLAFQKSRVVGITQVGAPAISILCILIFHNYLSVNIVVYALIMVSSLITVNGLIFIWIVKKENIKISINKVRISQGKELLTLGVKFFILQIVSVILYSTDNLIISAFIDAKEVAEYSISNKVFSNMNMFFSVLLIQLWSSTTKASAMKDFNWITKKVKTLLILLIPFTFCIVIIAISFKWIIHVWLNDTVAVRSSLVYVNAVYCVLVAWNGIITNVLNGLSELNYQIYIGFFTAILNIPLSLFFAIECGFGITGVLMATFICVLITSVVISIQYSKIVKKNNNITYEINPKS